MMMKIVNAFIVKFELITNLLFVLNLKKIAIALKKLETSNKNCDWFLLPHFSNKLQ